MVQARRKEEEEGGEDLQSVIAGSITLFTCLVYVYIVLSLLCFTSEIYMMLVNSINLDSGYRIILMILHQYLRITSCRVPDSYTSSS